MHSTLLLISTFILITQNHVAVAFSMSPLSSASVYSPQQPSFVTALSSLIGNDNAAHSTISPPESKDAIIMSHNRRSFLSNIATHTPVAAFAAWGVTAVNTPPALAVEEQGTKTDVKTVQTPLYYILRVREATEQETRLIKSGKFKDVQRANVKLAVKFMVDNYRLNDNFIAASAFLTGDRRIKAGDIGQTVVQNLYTILEYFDSSDVENIKVGSTGLGGKETIVLNGLQAAKKGIDDFVSFFPKEDVMAVVARIEEENLLNEREFDKELNQGSGILNPKPSQSS